MVVLGVGSLFVGLLGLVLIAIGADPLSAFAFTLGCVTVACVVYGFGEMVLGFFTLLTWVSDRWAQRAVRARRLAKHGTPIGAVEDGADVDLDMPGTREMLGL